MNEIKETLQLEQENIKALVSLIKNACIRYEQDGNNANISTIIERSQELHTARIRYNAFSYASKVVGKEEPVEIDTDNNKMGTIILDDGFDIPIKNRSKTRKGR